MLGIYCNEKLIDICSEPDYIKYDINTGEYTLVDNEEEANGLLVKNKLYSIKHLNTEVYPGAPIAEIEFEGHGANIMLKTNIKTEQSEENIMDVEDAVLDLNGITQEDLDDLRNAIFDLASQIANNRQQEA